MEEIKILNSNNEIIYTLSADETYDIQYIINDIREKLLVIRPVSLKDTSKMRELYNNSVVEDAIYVQFLIDGVEAAKLALALVNTRYTIKKVIISSKETIEICETVEYITKEE